MSPDLIVTVGWYFMIPKRMREIAPLGCIGIHGSLLPKYRGGAPLVWAIINGEKETGLTLFYLEDGVDDGDIIDQKSFPIEEEDTIKDLLVKLEEDSIKVLLNNLPKIEKGNAPRIKQDETIATYVPQRKPEDGEINWEWDSKRIKNFIRAQTKPYPGAFTFMKNKKIIIWDASIE
jgi:methionyl-tRNA formyltransferase